jgi:hypothetical protein
MGIGGSNTRFAFDRPAWQLCNVGQLGLLVLFVSLATAVFAQSTNPGEPQNPGAPQSPTTPDCTDPLLASSSQCSGQNQQDLNSNLPSQTQNQRELNSNLPLQARPPATPQNGNYSDIEQLSRQANGRNQTQQQLLPPEPPTEFQRFVTSTTGQSLPIYGANLFRSVPSTFAPLDMSPVPSDYVIGPGDELRIRVWGQVSFPANVRVDRSGDIFLPQVGPVHVAGLPFSELDGHLRSAIGRVYHNFDLTVDVGQIRAIQVYISG